jgi:hypothetical protein
MKTYHDNTAEKTCKEYALLISMLTALGVAMFGTGCAGIGASANIYRIDEHQESHKTYRNAIPLKCYFVNCAPEADEAQGS